MSRARYNIITLLGHTKLNSVFASARAHVPRPKGMCANNAFLTRNGTVEKIPNNGIVIELPAAGGKKLGI